MAWVESHTVLIRHRKTVSFALELGIKPVQAVGHLHALWHSALEQAEDGDLSKWTKGFIAAAACWEGDAEKFCKALVDCGWMTEAGLLHDWLDYVGRYLRDRYHSKNRAKLVEMWAKHGRSYGESTESPQKVGGNPVLPNPPNQPNLPDHTNHRVIATLPLPGTQGNYEVTDELLPAWKDAYPGVDIMQELAKMKAWLLANPKNRKTATGMGRFITSWLGRQQNRGAYPAQPQRQAAHPLSQEVVSKKDYTDGAPANWFGKTETAGSSKGGISDEPPFNGGEK